VTGKKPRRVSLPVIFPQKVAVQFFGVSHGKPARFADPARGNELEKIPSAPPPAGTPRQDSFWVGHGLPLPVLLTLRRDGDLIHLGPEPSGLPSANGTNQPETPAREPLAWTPGCVALFGPESPQIIPGLAAGIATLMRPHPSPVNPSR
jgi:hypothetical protein